MTEKKHGTGSYSKVSHFLNCPFLYYQKFIKGIDGKPNGAMIHGLKIHSLCEEIINTCADSDDVKKLLESKKEFYTGNKKKDEEFETNVIAFAEHILVDKTLIEKPESYFSVEVGGYTIDGHRDLCYYDADGNVIVEDIKTGGAIPSEEELRADMQLELYTVALVKELQGKGLPVEKVFNRIWIFPYHYFVQFERDCSDTAVEDVIARYKARAQEIKACGEDPNNFPRIDNKYCQGCEYLSTCFKATADTDVEVMTLKDMKALASKLKAQIDRKQTEMISEIKAFGGLPAPTEDGNAVYVLGHRSQSYWDMDIIGAWIKEGKLTLDEVITLVEVTEDKLKALKITDTTGLKKTVGTSEFITVKTKM